jgi:hypothetical protein
METDIHRFSRSTKSLFREETQRLHRPQAGLGTGVRSRPCSVASGSRSSERSPRRVPTVHRRPKTALRDGDGAFPIDAFVEADGGPFSFGSQSLFRWNRRPPMSSMVPWRCTASLTSRYQSRAAGKMRRVPSMARFLACSRSRNGNRCPIEAACGSSAATSSSTAESRTPRQIHGATLRY